MCSVINGPVAVNPEYTNKYRHIIREHCQVHTCFHGVMICVARGVWVEPLDSWGTPGRSVSTPAVVSFIFWRSASSHKWHAVKWPVPVIFFTIQTLLMIISQYWPLQHCLNPSCQSQDLLRYRLTRTAGPTVAHSADSSTLALRSQDSTLK